MKALTVKQAQKIIKEEQELHALRVRVNTFIISEQKRLTSLGYPEHLVVEAAGEFAMSFGTEFFKGYKNQFARYIISGIGLDPNSFISQVIGNVVEETPVSKLWDWFMGDGGGCEEFGEALTIGIIETMEENFLNPIMGQLGFRNVSTGSVGGTFREQFQTMINSSEFMQQVIDVVVETVCDFEMGSVLGFGGSGWARSGSSSSSNDTADPSEEQTSDPGVDMMSRINRSADLQKAITGGGRQPGVAARAAQNISDLVSDVVG